MAKSARSDLRRLAAAIRGRLDDDDFPMMPAFRAPAKAFSTTQTKFEAASAAVDEAESAKSDALAAVGEADDSLDASLDDYADDLSAAKLGPRQNPFKPFSKHSPSAMKDLPYAVEPKEVRALVAAVAKKNPPAAVKKAGTACLAKCTAVEKALAAYAKPASAYHKAVVARDALLPEMQKAIKTLKTHAASAYAEDEATLKALFAPPAAVLAPKLRRPRKAKPTNGAPAKPPSDAPTDQP